MNPCKDEANSHHVKLNDILLGYQLIARCRRNPLDTRITDCELKKLRREVKTHEPHSHARCKTPEEPEAGGTYVATSSTRTSTKASFRAGTSSAASGTPPFPDPGYPDPQLPQNGYWLWKQFYQTCENEMRRPARFPAFRRQIPILITKKAVRSASIGIRPPRFTYFFYDTLCHIAIDLRTDVGSLSDHNVKRLY